MQKLEKLAKRLNDEHLSPYIYNNEDDFLASLPTDEDFTHLTIDEKRLLYSDYSSYLSRAEREISDQARKAANEERKRLEEELEEARQEQERREAEERYWQEIADENYALQERLLNHNSKYVYYKYTCLNARTLDEKHFVDFFDEHIETPIFINFYKKTTNLDYVLPFYVPPKLYELNPDLIGGYSTPDYWKDILKFDAEQASISVKDRQEIFKLYSPFFKDGSFQKHLSMLKDRIEFENALKAEKDFLTITADGKVGFEELLSRNFVDIHNNMIYSSTKINQDTYHESEQRHFYCALIMHFIIYIFATVFSGSIASCTAALFISLIISFIVYKKFSEMGYIYRYSHSLEKLKLDLPFKKMKEIDLSVALHPGSVIDFAFVECPGNTMKEKIFDTLSTFNDVVNLESTSLADFLKASYEDIFTKIRKTRNALHKHCLLYLVFIGWLFIIATSIIIYSFLLYLT